MTDTDPTETDEEFFATETPLRAEPYTLVTPPPAPAIRESEPVTGRMLADLRAELQRARERRVASKVALRAAMEEGMKSAEELLLAEGNLATALKAWSRQGEKGSER